VIRVKVQQGIIHLLPISSKDQLADILTKSLHPGPFASLESKLGLLDIHSSLRGGVKQGICEATAVTCNTSKQKQLEVDNSLVSCT
jgi:hypothetical protein